MSNHPSELTSVGLEDLVKSISAPRFGKDSPRQSWARTGQKPAKAVPAMD